MGAARRYGSAYGYIYGMLAACFQSAGPPVGSRPDHWGIDRTLVPWRERQAAFGLGVLQRVTKLSQRNSTEPGF